jgi:hypothetical protein
MRSLNGQTTVVTDAITDTELCRLATSVPRTRASYIPPLPLQILQAVVEADAVIALPLILAIHRQLTMSGRSDTPLNDSIWRTAGSPSHKKRSAILRKLRAVPEIIQMSEARTPVSRYRVARGKAWEL